MESRDLVAGGLVVLGIGLVLHGMGLPEHTGGLDVDGPIGESSLEIDTVVAFEDLDAENRALFERALANEGEARYTGGDWNAEAVVYEGSYYRTLTWLGGNGRRTGTMNAGVGLSAIGIFVITGPRLVRRWQ